MFGLAMVSVFVFAGCNLFPGLRGLTQRVTISNVGWIVENIDTSFWSSPPDATAFGNFFIYFEEEDLEAQFIEQVTMTADGGNVSWTDDTEEVIAGRFSPDNNSYGGFLRLWTDNIDPAGHVYPLGDFTFEVELTNGRSDEFTLNVPAPGSLESSPYSYTFTEDYAQAGSPPSTYVALPERAGVTGASLASDTLTVTFTVNDSTVYSGWVWVYDANDDYLGTSWGGSSTPPFVTSAGSVSAVINNGTGLNTDGTTNTVELSAGDISFFDSNSTLSDIENVIVVLTDGEQYADPGETATLFYDTRSVSGRATVPTPP